MPNSNTFMIPAIKKLIMKYYRKNSIDPFALRYNCSSRKKNKYTSIKKVKYNLQLIII